MRIKLFLAVWALVLMLIYRGADPMVHILIINCSMAGKKAGVDKRTKPTYRRLLHRTPCMSKSSKSFGNSNRYLSNPNEKVSVEMT